MKKLKLSLDDLAVSSFVADEAGGSVFAMSDESLDPDYSCATCQRTVCNCTHQVGCYPSFYCTATGCAITEYDGCQTNNEGPC